MFFLESWVVDNLNSSFSNWNDKLGEIFDLITKSPDTFKDGKIWKVILNIYDSLQAIGLALLVLFFLVGVVKTFGSFAEVKKPEHAIKIFFRFAIAKAIVTYGLELMLSIFKIIQGVITNIMKTAGISNAMAITLPNKMKTAIEGLGFVKSIPFWALTLIGSLVITVLTFIMLMTVYGRFFKLYLYTAIAPIPLSTFASESTQNIGRNFLKSYIGVCFEGVIIILSCIIFSVFASTPPIIDESVSTFTQVWKYLVEVVFNMLILVGTIKMSDRVVKEMLGL